MLVVIVNTLSVAVVMRAVMTIESGPNLVIWICCVLYSEAMVELAG